MIAGVVVGNLAYYALAFGVLAPIQRASGHSPEEWLGVAFWLFMPIGLFTGGVLSGYVSRTIPAPILGFGALHAPGLYTFLLGLPFILRSPPGFQVFMLVSGVIWVVSSTVGVIVGKRWYGRVASAA